MASWRNYYRRKYRRYYRRKYGSSYGKRSYGQMKAAKQQADQASQVLNIPTSLTCKAVRAGNQERGTFALNIYDLLRKSEFYQSYANMYDEFKIDNIKVKLIPTKYNVTVGDTNGAGYQSFTVYTAWDRTGLNSKQLYLKADGVFNDNPIADNDAGRPNITGLNRDYIGKGDNDGLYCIVGSDITTYSSAESRQISVGQNSSITRWLKPKTLAEKSQWISTAQLEPWYYHYNETDCAYTYIPTYSDEVNIPSQVTTFNNNNNNRAIGTILSSISPAIANNPCFLEEDPTINFKPTLLVGLYPFEDGNSTVNPRAVSFNVETEVSVTFRGLRKSKVVSNSSSNNTPTAPVIQPLNQTVYGDGTVNYNAPTGTDGYNPVTITHITAFKPGVILRNNGYYSMTQTQEQGTQYPWFVPTIVPEEQQSIANFKIDVNASQASPITISSFMIGSNVQNDKHTLDTLTLLTFPESQDPSVTPQRELTIGAEQYLILVYNDTTAVNLYHQVKIVVNNTDNDFTYAVNKDDSADIYHWIDTNWYGGDASQGNEKIPIDCTLIDNTNNSVVVFGDDEDYGEDNTQHNQVSTSFVNLRKDIYTFDFGMQE